MTRRPFGAGEIDGGPDEDAVARELERYAALTSGELPHGLVQRVQTSLAAEPTPRRGLLAALVGFGELGRLPRALLVGATMALAVLAVMLAGQLGFLFRDPQIGPSPSPPFVTSPTPSPTPTPTPRATPPTERPSESPSVSPKPTRSPSETAAPTPTATQDGERETPEPSDDDHSGPGGGDEETETPEPSDEDH